MDVLQDVADLQDDVFFEIQDDAVALGGDRRELIQFVPFVHGALELQEASWFVLLHDPQVPVPDVQAVNGSTVFFSLVVLLSFEIEFCEVND